MEPNQTQPTETPAGADAPAAHPPTSNAFAWQEMRKRPGAGRESDGPITGFGTGAPGAWNGDVTLWLPNAEATERWAFKDGKPHAAKVDGAITELPHLIPLRNVALQQMNRVTSADPLTGALGVLRAGPAFLEYAAALILARYDVSDDDLGMLLAGRKWRGPILTHLLGGEDALSILASNAPDLILAMAGNRGHVPAPDPTETPSPAPEPASVRRTRMERVWDRVKGVRRG